MTVTNLPGISGKMCPERKMTVTVTSCVSTGRVQKGHRREKRSSLTKNGKVAHPGKENMDSKSIQTKSGKTGRILRHTLQGPPWPTEGVLHTMVMVTNTEHPSVPGHVLSVRNTFTERKQSAILDSVGPLNKRPKSTLRGSKDNYRKIAFSKK